MFDPHMMMLALMLLGAHWLCDYPLQGQYETQIVPELKAMDALQRWPA